MKRGGAGKRTGPWKPENAGKPSGWTKPWPASAFDRTGRRCELSLELRQETGTQILPYQADSWGLGGGVWLVGAWREDGQSPSLWLEGSYTLRLYDEKDTLLKQREGAIPRPL